MEEDRLAKQQAEAAKNNSLLNITADEISTLDMEQGVQGIARDHLNESMFGPDDFVLLRNIFDGEEHFGFKMPSLAYVFQYGGQSYRVKGGQKFTLSGAQAYIYVKHIVSLIYRRIENKPDEDRRTYDLNNRWVKEIVERVDATLSPDDGDRNVVQDIPAYMQDDPNLSKTIGGGDHELNTQIDDSDATDEQIDSVPDFNPALNPRQEFDAEGKVVENTDTENVADAKEEFPGRKKATSQNKK